MADTRYVPVASPLNVHVATELLPLAADESLQQKTEDTIGPYELHDFFLFHFVRHGSSTEKIRWLAAQAFAIFDVSLALADLAIRENWCRPKVDNSYAFAISGGRHPVVEHALKSQSGASFIANDSALDDNKIWLLTGPNMAGKSTFLKTMGLGK